MATATVVGRMILLWAWMGVPEMSQDMSLFEVQRILDVWPSLQDGHVTHLINTTLN